MRKGRKEWRALVQMQLNELHAAIFAWPWLCSFGPPSFALVVITWERGGMLLHDAVGINCKNRATTEIQGSDL